MTGYTVSADHKGERIYLSSRVYPRQELLSLNNEPVVHDQAEAERIAAMARADESLSDVRVSEA